MAVYGVYDLDHRRAGFPSSVLSEAHQTITTDKEFHLTLVSRDGSRNNFFYDSHGNFVYQRGAQADYIWNNYRQGYQDLEREAIATHADIVAYIA